MNLKLKLFIIIGLIGFGNMNAQEYTSSYVLDSETNEPIPYVNVSIKDSNNGTVSDPNGKFEIRSISIKDSLVISSIGYETQIVCVIDISEEQPILMTLADYLIDEVQISSSAFNQEVILGERNEKERGHSFGFGSAQLGTELGALIEIEKETFIKNVNVVLNHAKGDSLLFRVNIYNYEDGKIGDNILKENIFLKEKQRKGRFTLDVTEYEIVLNNDVLLSIEWLRNFDETGNKSITFDTKKSNSLEGTYIKYSSHSEFQRLTYKKKYKPCIYFVGMQNSD